jgi:cytochrome c-type biogenesis protein CcmH
MRAQIEKQIVAGMTDDAIVEEFVVEHGKVVLATPPPEGLNLAAWVMPGFAILIGFFLLAYFLTGWIAKKKTRPISTGAELDPAFAERIEKELHGMDR